MFTLKIDFSLDFLGEISELPLHIYSPKTQKTIKNETAVYIIFNSENEIIYIGESCDVKSRLKSHLYMSRFRNEIAFMGVFYKDMDKYERISLEAMLTKQYNPKHDRSDHIKRLASKEEEAKAKAPLMTEGKTRVSKGVFFEIRNLIVNSDMTKQAIADKFGVHRNTIGNIAGLKLSMYKQWEADRILNKL